MLQVRLVLSVLVVLAHLAACQSEASIPHQAQQDRAMYQAVIGTFFRDDHVQRLFQEDLLQHKTVYIQPTFFNSDVPIPADIVEMIAARTAAQGLVRVPSEQPGGVIIGLSPIGNDAAAATVYNQRGPTIYMSAQISGISCGASIGIGYLVTPIDAGWQAQDYVQAVC